MTRGEVAYKGLERISEHQGACRKGEEKKSAVAEHAWKEHHPIRWQETSVIDRASRFGELRVKEALHIHLTPEDQRFNRDVGLELPGCWVSTLKALREATPTTIGFFILEPVMYHALRHLSKPL